MKWGILATGTIAKKFASTVEQMGAEGEQLVAVGSRHLESAQAFAQQYGIPRCYGSYEALPQIRRWRLSIHDCQRRGGSSTHPPYPQRTPPQRQGTLRRNEPVSKRIPSEQKLRNKSKIKNYGNVQRCQECLLSLFHFARQSNSF